ncbi:MAG: IS605 OrfB-like transposable element containing RNAse H-like and Zn finger domain [Candidatus Methanohalarchaeum thermophilum]|uniref:IS605 OrfB-like transposable element containing RNAse H-like and Zn finger domain n=1 Tax=Methanohalarchaeum thermophilum TaxID=1903181 RepID=A0A1Q6DVK6_METT1|nr:MAG: IS605 OrfB-like transposable element containing RNAse H-like and Zn finger domain [Candidatus Methanohalarchaeum thermophilum]
MEKTTPTKTRIGKGITIKSNKTTNKRVRGIINITQSGCMIIYKLRMYPSDDQEEKLGETLELCRWIYNHFLKELNKSEEVPSRYELQKELPELKDKKPELKQVHSKVLQNVLRRLYSNLKALSDSKKNGYKVGRLRYKSKGWYKTFTYSQSGYKIKETKTRRDLIKLSKIGEIPIRKHRQVKNEIKNVFVKREQAGKWFVSIVTDFQKDLSGGEGVVATDLNTTNYLTDSDELVIENPKYLEEKEERLQKEKQKFDRKEKGSNKYEKQRKRVAKKYEELRDAKKDFLPSLSRVYIENYGTIILGDLSISDMFENSYFAKSNLDASLGRFRDYLRYKAESAGTKIIFVDPDNTTQTYSNCGEKVSKNIWDREHECPRCGFSTTRDHNSALNILKKGLDSLGKGQAEVTPVDTGTPAGHFVSASSVVELGTPSHTEAEV